MITWSHQSRKASNYKYCNFFLKLKILKCFVFKAKFLCFNIQTQQLYIVLCIPSFLLKYIKDTNFNLLPLMHRGITMFNGLYFLSSRVKDRIITLNLEYSASKNNLNQYI